MATPSRAPLPKSKFSGPLPPGGLYWKDYLNVKRHEGLNRWQRNHFRLMSLIEYQEGVVQGSVERLLTRLGVTYRQKDYVPTDEEIVQRLAVVSPEIMNLIIMHGKVAALEMLVKQQYDLKGKYRNYFQGGRLPRKITLGLVDEYLGETGAKRPMDSHTMEAYTRRMSEELATVTRRHIEETVAQGTALNWSRGRTQEELTRRFKEEQSKRADLDMSKAFPNVETVIRTESMKIMNAEAWRSATEVGSYASGLLWGFTYNAVGDSRTRETHLAQDEVSAPVDDPFWDEWTPPNGYNCRCWLVSEFEQPETIKPPRRDIKPDKGFSFNPGKQISGPSSIAPKPKPAKPAIPLPVSQPAPVQIAEPEPKSKFTPTPTLTPAPANAPTPIPKPIHTPAPARVSAPAPTQEIKPVSSPVQTQSDPNQTPSRSHLKRLGDTNYTTVPDNILRGEKVTELNLNSSSEEIDKLDKILESEQKQETTIITKIQPVLEQINKSNHGADKKGQIIFDEVEYGFVIKDEKGTVIGKIVQKGFEFDNRDKGIWKVVLSGFEQSFKDLTQAVIEISRFFAKKYGISFENLLLSYKKPTIIEEDKVTVKSDDENIQKRLDEFNDKKCVKKRVQRNEKARLNSQQQWEGIAHQKGVSIDEYRTIAEKRLQEIFKMSSLYVRVRAIHSLLVIKDERIKTQFETNTSQGLNDQVKRAKRESELFGYNKSLAVINQSFRPVYGFISDDNNLESGSAARSVQYGSIIFKLKDSVKSRTTWCTRDSLGRDSTIEPDFGSSFVSRPTLEGISTIGIKDIASITKADDLVDISYVEIQVHGQVTLDDVEEVIIDQKIAMRRELQSRLIYKTDAEYNKCIDNLKQELDRRGIPFTILL